MRLCAKCDNIIPYKIKINGKWRNLKNRKYCLVCSPFGQHNTRNLTKDNPRTTQDGKKLPYANWTDDAKDEMRARIFWRGHLRKEKLVEMKGGCCELCGYDTCLRALQFHHTDPNLKSFSLDTRIIQTKCWELVLNEVEKCQLLCANCHAEEEAKQSGCKYESYKERFLKIYPDSSTAERQMH